MKVSLDLDGVLYPWHQVVWKEHFADDDYFDFWKERWKHVKTSTWNKILPDPDLYVQPARADVVQMVHRIANSRFVYYVTQRPKSLTRVTQRWLVRNGFPNPGDVYMTQDKVATCNKIGIDLHIDDRIDVMHNLADNGIRVLGVRQPWNEDRIDDFPHVDNILSLEREIARIESTQKAYRRRNGNG
jgi:uncharacterized HAD superfamily protein